MIVLLNAIYFMVLYFNVSYLFLVRISNAVKKCKMNVKIIRQLVFPTSSIMLISNNFWSTFQKCNFNDWHLIWTIALFKLKTFLQNSYTNMPVTFLLQHRLKYIFHLNLGPKVAFNISKLATICNVIKVGLISGSKVSRTID